MFYEILNFPLNSPFRTGTSVIFSHTCVKYLCGNVTHVRYLCGTVTHVKYLCDICTCVKYLLKIGSSFVGAKSNPPIGVSQA